MTARKLRIGFVAHAGVGGSSSVAVDLAAGLGARGHDAHLVAIGRPSRLANGAPVTLHEVDVPRHPMWSEVPWSLALTAKIAEVAREAKLDLVHAHFAVPYAIAADHAREMLDRPIPLVVTLHGTDVSQLFDEPAFGPLVRLALARAQAVTVPSRALADELAPRWRGPALVMANSVDTDRFSPDASRRAPADELVLVHASNFRPVKRVDDVVEVFARVVAKRSARLLLAGSGPTHETALSALRDAGLLDHVEAPGSLCDVERFLRRGHVALLPSEHESFGLAALEALACGTPVVGSRVGGLPEVVEHGRTGFLAAVGDVGAMAEAVLALAADPARWKAASKAARDDAVKRFSRPRALDRLEQLYRDVLARPFDLRFHPSIRA